VGSSSGSLYAFDDREVSFGADKAHEGPILCLAEGNAECTFLVSGGRDNTIRVWNQSLQPISVYNISKVCVSAAGISSLDIRPSIEGYDAQNNDLAILVGTVGGDVVELTLSPTPKDAEVKLNLDISRAHDNVLVSSHSVGELWGLAVHPTNPDLYVTVGDDASLRIWSIKKQRMVYFMALPRPARSVAWAVLPHDDSQGATVGSELIAVGFSGLESKSKMHPSAKDHAESADAKGSKPASIQLYSAQIIKGNYKLDLLSEGSPTNEWVSALHFSPLFIHDDGTGNGSASRMRLGAGCHDRNIYFYDLPNIDELMDSTSDEKASSHLYAGVLSSPSYLYKKHSSAIINFDFSLDGTAFQSNCQAGELLFGAFVQDGADPDRYKVVQKTSATEMAQYNGMKDVDGDPNFWSQQTCTLGWPVQGIWPPGADTMDINACDRSPKEDFLATVDDFGLLKIFRYPCVTEGSKYLKFGGHSSHVTSVRWTLGEYLITTGGNDKCIFVWRTENK
jgi:WD40 repeat protein